jgi:DNA-binding XRE family transcriptional regulator
VSKKQTSGKPVSAWAVPVRPIHANIKRIRIARKMTQSDLATALDLDKTSISHWETGKSAPNWKRLPDVADVLGTTVEQLQRSAKRAA